MFLYRVAWWRTSPFGEGFFLKGLLFLNPVYMKKVDSMSVHLAVSVASYSAFSSRPTLTFCDLYVTQFCRDL